jgi:tetratricopeptide (TPR) repeat protein
MARIALTPPEALKRAIAANHDGRLSEAERLCQAIITFKPDFFEALHLLAVVQTRLGRRNDALASYERALAVRPDDAAALNNRGLILQALKRFDEALASYDRVLAARPDHAEALNNRGTVLRELKRFDEALASYDQALVVRPDAAAALNNRGIVLQELKRFDEALASYEKAIALKPDYADALYNRGAVLRALKRFDEALPSYAKAIALNPDYGPIYRSLISPNLNPVDVPQMNSGTACTTANVEQVLKAHWCLGMHASASTWIYNVTRQIAASVYPTRPVQEHFVKMLADVARLDQPGRTHLVKTHDIDDEDAVAALSVRTAAIIVTIRDPRDAVTSWMLYHPHGHDLAKPSEAQKAFDRSLSIVEKSARFCARFAGDQRSLLLRYEARFTDDVTALDRIAGTFQKSLAATDRARIFASSHRAAVEAFIAELPRQRTTLIDISSDDLMDPVTHWHTHHAGRNGEIGRWRHMLTEAQALEVERRLGDWMDRFSYQRNTARAGA